MQVDEGVLDDNVLTLMGTMRFHCKGDALQYTLTLTEVDGDEIRDHGKYRDRNDTIILRIFDEDTTYEYTFQGDIEIHRFTIT